MEGARAFESIQSGLTLCYNVLSFPSGLLVKKLSASAGDIIDVGLMQIGRSPEEYGHSTVFSSGSPMDRGADGGLQSQQGLKSGHIERDLAPVAHTTS